MTALIAFVALLVAGPAAAVKLINVEDLSREGKAPTNLLHPLLCFVPLYLQSAETAAATQSVSKFASGIIDQVQQYCNWLEPAT